MNLSQKLHYSDKLFIPTVYSKKESLFCTGFKTELFSFAGIVAKIMAKHDTLDKAEQFTFTPWVEVSG
jgi:hypothetical protein